MTILNRTLIRIKDITETKMSLIIPGWNPKKVVTISKESIKPDELLDGLDIGDHLFVKVDLGANSPKELNFTDFEKPLDLTKNIFLSENLLKKAQQRYTPGTGPWTKEENLDEVDLAYIEHIADCYSIYSDEKGMMSGIIQRLLEEIKRAKNE